MNSHRLVFSILFWILISLFYFVSHLWALANLPIFADEAIYIRWAQLIQDEPLRYLFFALNDGKTPLYIWQLVISLPLFSDPLYAARFLSVVGGFFQVLAGVWLVREVKGGRLAQLLVAFLFTILPFWFFHHRIALMDGWMTLWITCSLAALIHALESRQLVWAVGSGLFLGAAILTKIPAVLILPSFGVLLFWSSTKGSFWVAIKCLVVTGLVSLIVSATLLISPAFPQLFARSSDFLFSVTDVFRGIWLQTIFNTPSYLNYFWQYLTAGGVVLSLLAVMWRSSRRKALIVIGCFLAYSGPIALMGRVVFPRYFLPAALFLTVLAALSLEKLLISATRWKQTAGLLLLIIIIYQASQFIVPALSDPNQIPFVSADQGQYLTEWSSGHGIKETFFLITQAAKSASILVATEGYFGTLPDGLLVYFHHQDLFNIAIEGVGQPINSVPQKLIDDQDAFNTLWLVVNSHRLNFALPENALFAEYCRPYQGPCLQVWDLTEFIKSGSYAKIE